METKHRIALALDVDTAKEALDWVDLTRDYVGIYKVGLQLYIRGGNSLIEALRKIGAKRIFLDLKLHDIPNTVAGAVRQIMAMGTADYLTIHTGGGLNMMQAAVQAAGSKLMLLGVTVLTSLDRVGLEEIGINTTPRRLAIDRAILATEGCGMRGLICSPHEAKTIRLNVPKNTTIGTPGIRLAGGDVGDQKRVATPKFAIEQGASFMVLGRAVRGADDPLAVLRQIHADIVMA